MAFFPSQRALSSAAAAIFACVALALSVTATDRAADFWGDTSDREILSACTQGEVSVARVRVAVDAREWLPRWAGPLEPEPEEPGLDHGHAGRSRWERWTAAVSSQGPPAV